MATEYDEPTSAPQEVAYAAVGAGAMLATSTLMANFVDLDWRWVAGGSGAAALAAVAITNRVMTEDERAGDAVHLSAVASTGIVGISAAAWMTYAQYIGSTGNVGQWLSAAGIASVAAVLGWLHRWWLSRVSETEVEHRRAERETQRLGVWGQILTSAGHTRQVTDEDGNKHTEMSLEIVEETETEFGISARVRGKDFNQFKKLFVDKADEEIGFAAVSVLDAEITTAGVTIERTKAPGYAWIHILTRDIITETLEWSEHPDGPQPECVTTPLHVGRYTNAEPIELRQFRTHMQILGESQSGKSSLVNRVIEKWTRASNALVWIGGTWKLPRAVNPWLEGMSFQGRNNRPVLDWVAPNQQRILEMLATALEESASREADPAFLALDAPTAEYPAILIILDECQHPLDAALDHCKIKCHDGVMRSAGDLVDVLTSGATSSFIQVVFSTQSALFADMGPRGGRIKSNLGLSIAFRSGRDDFLEKVITGVKASMNKTHLIAPGVMMVQQSGQSIARLGKAVYITTSRIPALAAARADMAGRMPDKRAAALTVGTLPRLGSAYARRFHFSDGSIEQFFKAIAAGNSYDDTTYKKPDQGQQQTATTNPQEPHVPGRMSPEEARALGLDPNMSLEEAQANFQRLETNQKVAKRVRSLDEATVDERFAAIAAAEEPPAPDQQRPVTPTQRTQRAVPEIVNALIAAFDGYKTFTGQEAAVALGILASDEPDQEKVREAREAVGNEIYEATGLRAGQHRDSRHMGSRRRCFRVADIEQARLDMTNGH